jgi:hypothetical protein
MQIEKIPEPQSQEEDLLTQIEKIPEPQSHPYTAAPHPHKTG